MIYPYPKIEILEMEGQYYEISDPRINTEIINVSNPDFQNALIDLLFPVGSVYISMNAFAPFTRGNWVQIGKGEALVGVDTESDFEKLNTAGQEFGSAQTTLPRHNHGESTSQGLWEAGMSSVTTSANGRHRHSLEDRFSESSATGTKQAYVLQPNRVRTTRNTDYEDNHTHTISAAGLNQLKKHTHGVDWDGVDPANTNYPPSITVYIWKRIEDPE